MILYPPKAEAYDALEQAVLQEFSPNIRDRLNSLLKSVGLSDRKPSAVLQDMQDAAGTGGVSDELLQELWLTRVPESVIVKSYMEIVYNQILK